MRPLALTALILSGMAALAIYTGFEGCRWLDRLLGRSGCVARYHVADMSSIGSTLALDGEGTLVVAGVDYRSVSHS